MLRAAALAGLGVALLPEDSRVEDVLRGALIRALSQLSTRSPSRALRRVKDDRGWFPAKGSLISGAGTGEDLHAVESGFDRVAGGARTVGDRLADFVGAHRPRRDRRFTAGRCHRTVEQIDVGRRQRLRAAAHVRMGDGAGVPELRNDAAAGSGSV
jgi:hypothetical protein